MKENNHHQQKRTRNKGSLCMHTYTHTHKWTSTLNKTSSENILYDWIDWFFSILALDPKYYIDHQKVKFHIKYLNVYKLWECSHSNRNQMYSLLWVSFLTKFPFPSAITDKGTRRIRSSKNCVENKHVPIY